MTYLSASIIWKKKSLKRSLIPIVQNPSQLFQHWTSKLFSIYFSIRKSHMFAGQWRSLLTLINWVVRVKENFICFLLVALSCNIFTPNTSQILLEYALLELQIIRRVLHRSPCFIFRISKLMLHSDFIYTSSGPPLMFSKIIILFEI